MIQIGIYNISTILARILYAYPYITTIEWSIGLESPVSEKGYGCK